MKQKGTYDDPYEYNSRDGVINYVVFGGHTNFRFRAVLTVAMTLASMICPLTNDDVFFVHRFRCFACNVGRAVLLRHPFVRYVSDDGSLVYKPMLTKGINNKLVGR